MKQYLFVIAIVLGCCSCTNNMYFPDRVCVANLKEKGEWKANASAKLQANNITKSYVGLSADGVYSFADHFYCQGSYRNTINRSLRSLDYILGYNTAANYNDHRGEIGVGTYFLPDLGWQIDLAGGYGMGVISREYMNKSSQTIQSPLDESSYNASYKRIFFQFSGSYTNGTTQLSAGARFAGQFGYNFDRPLMPGNVAAGSFDPYADLEIGRKLRFNMQFGFSFFEVSRSYYSVDAKPYLSMGVSYHYMKGKKVAVLIDDDPR
jgi:hypothetical protein